MSPSRGFYTLLRARPQINKLQATRRYSDFVRAATNPENKSQIYVSRTDDPYVNLSIEHYLLQKTPADSTVLFVYTNRPCIVFGRNQNPWVEANLGMIRNSGLNASLVRRRSGGGTVFHDKGNVNYSVICPTPDFNRDKHAEMVVQALKQLGLEKVRVNERHDIVYDKTIDVEEYSEEVRSGKGKEGDLIEKTFKISGSAYKLTRLRSLHHGTCIASTRNLHAFSRYLRSPAKPLIVARGVESVSSPVTHIEREPEKVEKAVVAEFSAMYGAGDSLIVTDAELAVPEIAAGVKELKSDDWIYGQTPQFTFSTENAHHDWDVPEKFKAAFTCRHGVISDLTLDYSPDDVSATSDFTLQDLASSLDGKKLHEIRDWSAAFKLVGYQYDREPYSEASPMGQAGKAMNRLFGTGGYELDEYIRPWGLAFKDFLEAKKNGPSNEKDANLIARWDNEYEVNMPEYTEARMRHIEREKSRGR